MKEKHYKHPQQSFASMETEPLFLDIPAELTPGVSFATEASEVVSLFDREQSVVRALGNQAIPEWSDQLAA